MGSSEAPHWAAIGLVVPGGEKKNMCRIVQNWSKCGKALDPSPPSGAALTVADDCQVGVLRVEDTYMCLSGIRRLRPPSHVAQDPDGSPTCSAVAPRYDNRHGRLLRLEGLGIPLGIKKGSGLDKCHVKYTTLTSLEGWQPSVFCCVTEGPGSACV